MTKKTNKKSKGNKPDIKSKAGIFQLSAWKGTKVIAVDEEKNPYGIEREFKQITACLSIGQRKKDGWVNVEAWFRSPQFGDLEECVDDFRKQLKELVAKEEREAE